MMASVLSMEYEVSENEDVGKRRRRRFEKRERAVA